MTGKEQNEASRIDERKTRVYAAWGFITAITATMCLIMGYVIERGMQ